MSHIKDAIVIDYPHLVSYYTLIGRLLHQFGRQQGMLGRVRPPGFRNEQTYFLICSSPLRVQLTVVAERYLYRQPGRRREKEVNYIHKGLARMSPKSYCALMSL